MHGERDVPGTDLRPAWLVGVFLLALLLRVASFTGLIASDDLSYSEFAERIAAGGYEPYRHHFAVRYGLTVPVGLVYALAGVGEWTTIAVPLVASSLAVPLLASIGTRLFDARAGIVAALLYATFPLSMRYATVLVPEAVAECYLLLGVLAYLRASEGRAFAMTALAGACVGLAYLSKEPAVFVGPALFLDALLRRRWTHAAGMAAGLSAVIAIEHSYYLATTGELLFRYQSVAAHNRTNAPEEGAASALAFRLLQAYPRMMLEPNVHFGLHSLAALTLSAIALWRFRRDRRAHLLLLWAALPWLYLNYGTSSFSRYVPIPAAPRYIMFVYPPLFLLSGWILSRAATLRPPARTAIAAAMGGLLALGAVSAQVTRATGYRTAEVAVLRSIAHRWEANPSGCVRFEFEAGWQTKWLKIYWAQTLHILSSGRIRVCDGQSGAAVIGRDRLGLPYVVPGAGGDD
jgi:4-amino-4-deoxy-L-arabinose transferase-like glycosyltransferase